MSEKSELDFGPEEKMLRDSAAKFLADRAGIERLRALVASDHEGAYHSDIQPAPYDEELWRSMVELGWTTLAVCEDGGGAGMSALAVAALAEEIGRAAVPSPLPVTLQSTMILNAGMANGGAACAQWLERIVGGAPFAPAVAGIDGVWEKTDYGVSAQAADGGWVLRGTAPFVADARKADFFVVAAGGPDGPMLFAVATDTPGVVVRPDRIVDLTRDQASLLFDDVELSDDKVLTDATQTEATLSAALPSLLLLTAADLCGSAEWQLQTTTEYARVRTQFDRPIGFFQAVKHPIVNTMVAIDRARSLVYAAAAAIDHASSGEAERLARMAKAAAGDAAALASDRSVQLHGGIGFTWECDVHIYFKRQQHSRFLYGDAPHHRAALAAQM